jgi:arginase family enzyme
VSELFREECILFFGASLDGSDHEESVALRRAYVETVAPGRSDETDPRDPYALFRKWAGERFSAAGHRWLGRFAIESWLTPRPQPGDAPWVDPRAYRQFLIEGGFKRFSELLKGFVMSHVLPSVPGMIGVDHSLTGGVLMALSERVGPENLGIVVFDVHTDAVPIPIRSGLARYGSEKGWSSPATFPNDSPADPYATGNFLLHLIDEKVIRPSNLVIVGVGDHGEGWKHSKDRSVMEYVKHYDALLGQGVRIVSRDVLKRSGPAAVERELVQLRCSDLYVSLDVDVSAQRDVLAARYLDLAGTEKGLILETLAEILRFRASSGIRLAGFDIMEIDIHRLGAELPDGSRDGTEDFVREFLLLISRAQGPRREAAGRPPAAELGPEKSF